MTGTTISLLQHFCALSGSTPSDKLLRQIILRDYEDAQENAVTSTTVRQTKKAARKGGLSPALEAYTAPNMR
jgi:hypothetical protein